MINYKNEVLSKICYTDLVYGRINKKLKLKLSNTEIEKMLLQIIQKTEETDFLKRGKNIYITSENRNIRITINTFSNRVITADLLKKKKR